ncbi:PEP-CTERM sorting domain-containing protein [Oceaniferula spumae]
MKTKPFVTLLGLLISGSLSQAATLNISPFGTATLVDGQFGTSNGVVNPHGGIDGRTGTFFHTGNGGTGQYSVALVKATNLSSIELVNRGDVNNGRAVGAFVEVLDSSNSVLFSTTIATNAASYSFDNGGAGFLGAATLRISHTSNFLHLSEVRAYADSVATGVSTSGAAAFGFPTVNGNDGDFTNFTHGNDNTTDFWQVDLGSAKNLDWVSILGRQNFEERTNLATITLLGADGTTVIASDTISGLTNNGAGAGSFSMTDGYQGVQFIKVDGVNFLHVGELAAIEAVPEPSSTALLGLGGLALILRRRK